MLSAIRLLTACRAQAPLRHFSLSLPVCQPQQKSWREKIMKKKMKKALQRRAIQPLHDDPHSFDVERDSIFTKSTSFPLTTRFIPPLPDFASEENQLEREPRRNRLDHTLEDAHLISQEKKKKKEQRKEAKRRAKEKEKELKREKKVAKREAKRAAALHAANRPLIKVQKAIERKQRRLERKANFQRIEYENLVKEGKPLFTKEQAEIMGCDIYGKYPDSEVEGSTTCQRIEYEQWVKEGKPLFTKERAKNMGRKIDGQDGHDPDSEAQCSTTSTPSSSPPPTSTSTTTPLTSGASYFSQTPSSPSNQLDLPVDNPHPSTELLRQRHRTIAQGGANALITEMSPRETSGMQEEREQEILVKRPKKSASALEKERNVMHGDVRGDGKDEVNIQKEEDRKANAVEPQEILASLMALEAELTTPPNANTHSTATSEPQRSSDSDTIWRDLKDQAEALNWRERGEDIWGKKVGRGKRERREREMRATGGMSGEFGLRQRLSVDVQENITPSSLTLNAIHGRFKGFLLFPDVRTVVDIGAGECGWSKYVKWKLDRKWQESGGTVEEEGDWKGSSAIARMRMGERAPPPHHRLAQHENGTNDMMIKELVDFNADFRLPMIPPRPETTIVGVDINPMPFVQGVRRVHADFLAPGTASLIDVALSRQIPVGATEDEDMIYSLKGVAAMNQPPRGIQEKVDVVLMDVDVLADEVREYLGGENAVEGVREKEDDANERERERMQQITMSLRMCRATWKFAKLRLRTAQEVGRRTGGVLVMRHLPHPLLLRFRMSVLDPHFEVVKYINPRSMNIRDNGGETQDEEVGENNDRGSYFICQGFKGPDAENKRVWT